MPAIIEPPPEGAETRPLGPRLAWFAAIAAASAGIVAVIAYALRALLR